MRAGAPRRMSDTPGDPRAELASRLLVTLLAGIFLLGLLGFVVAVLDAGDQAGGAGPATVPPSPRGCGHVSSPGGREALRILLAWLPGRPRIAPGRQHVAADGRG